MPASMIDERGTTDRSIGMLLGWPLALCFAAAMVLPLLVTAIPPLVDLPGHLGRFAIQAAPQDSPLRAWFDQRWGIGLNLGTDLLVEGLRHWLGLVAATWLVTALIQVLTVAGIIAVTRQVNRRGAWALPWALIFVHGHAFRFGFLNFALGSALALLGFALWLRLEARAGLRAALFLPFSALILVVHAIGGGLMTVMIAGDLLWRRSRRGSLRAAAAGSARLLWPLLGGVAMVAAWTLFGSPAGGATRWVLERKLDGLTMAVRDQDPIFDIATMVAALLVLVLGWRQGARMRVPGAVAALALLFIASPAVLSGVAHVDERIVPVLMMLALAAQDWSTAPARARRLVLWSGMALLVIRLAVTIIAFAGYGVSYARELRALDHVAPHSRVLALVQVDCGLREWRSARLDHIANLATLYRGAWVNAHWTIEGVQQLRVLYRPSADFFDDPSEFVWPARCFDPAKPYAARPRHSVEEVLPRLPLDGVDYVWLINADRPGIAGMRLDKRWSDGSSALYAVRPVPNRAPAS